MKQELRIAAAMTLVTLVLSGLVYPLVVMGIARIAFPSRAAGSLVTVDGRLVGSELIGQRFADPGYFQGRPSAAGSEGYDAAASSGSNLGPTSQALRDRVAADLERLKKENLGTPGPVPIELVTTSASGLDPHISPEAARWQIPRVAAVRGVAASEIEALVASHVEGRAFGLLGEPRLNVLLTNIDLDERFPGSLRSNRTPNGLSPPGSGGRP